MRLRGALVAGTVAMAALIAVPTPAHAGYKTWSRVSGYPSGWYCGKTINTPQLSYQGRVVYSYGNEYSAGVFVFNRATVTVSLPSFSLWAGQYGTVLGFTGYHVGGPNGSGSCPASAIAARAYVTCQLYPSPVATGGGWQARFEAKASTAGYDESIRDYPY